MCLCLPWKRMVMTGVNVSTEESYANIDICWCFLKQIQHIGVQSVSYHGAATRDVDLCLSVLRRQGEIQHSSRATVHHHLVALRHITGKKKINIFLKKKMRKTAKCFVIKNCPSKRTCLGRRNQILSCNLVICGPQYSQKNKLIPLLLMPWCF